MSDSKRESIHSHDLPPTPKMRCGANAQSAREADERVGMVGILNEEAAVPSNTKTRKSQSVKIEGAEADTLSLHVKNDLDQLSDFRRAVQRMQERVRATRLDVAQLRLDIAGAVDPLLLQRRHLRRSKSTTSEFSRTGIADRNLH